MSSSWRLTTSEQKSEDHTFWFQVKLIQFLILDANKKLNSEQRESQKACAELSNEYFLITSIFKIRHLLMGNAWTGNTDNFFNMNFSMNYSLSYKYHGIQCMVLLAEV